MRLNHEILGVSWPLQTSDIPCGTQAMRLAGTEATPLLHEVVMRGATGWCSWGRTVLGKDKGLFHSLLIVSREHSMAPCSGPLNSFPHMYIYIYMPYIALTYRLYNLIFIESSILLIYTFLLHTLLAPSIYISFLVSGLSSVIVL